MKSNRMPEIFPPSLVTPEHLPGLRRSHAAGAALHDDAYVEDWIHQKRQAARINAMLVPLEELEGWRLDPSTGNICHATGRFFSVIGIQCRHRYGRAELEWDQPIIEQPETGILGILVKTIKGIPHFCLQAKEEPGNIGGMQLSPTVQATYSNYTAAHGGSLPPFLEHFTAPAAGRVLLARMQTEDGGRFLYKSNRNMLVMAGEEFPQELPDGFIWLTLRQIGALLKRDNLINACARSILAGLFTCATAGKPAAIKDQPDALAGIVDTLQWLDDGKAANHMLARRIGLKHLQEWGVDEKGFFSHHEKRFFRIVGMQITTAAREVRSWCQPIIENPSPGIIGLLLRQTPQGLEALMQAKAEVGNRVSVQLGPTVQFTQGNYAESRKLRKPFLYEEFVAPKAYEVLHESRQAEEGARFYRECHIHRILMLPEGLDLPISADFRWLPLAHVQLLVQLGEQVNSCARSILTCLL